MTAPLGRQRKDGGISVDVLTSDMGKERDQDIDIRTGSSICLSFSKGEMV